MAIDDGFSPRKSVYSRDPVSPEVAADVSLEEETPRQRGSTIPKRPVVAPDFFEAPPELGLIYPQISSDMFEENLKAEDLPGKPKNVNNESWLAFQTAQMLHKKNPDLFGDTKNAYRALRLGEVDFLPEGMKNLPLSDRDIMRIFLRNPNNEPMREGSFIRGFGKQIAPSA